MKKVWNNWFGISSRILTAELFLLQLALLYWFLYKTISVQIIVRDSYDHIEVCDHFLIPTHLSRLIDFYGPNDNSSNCFKRQHLFWEKFKKSEVFQAII